MFGFLRRRSGEDVVRALHGRVVEAARNPDLYGPGGFPDTVDGRFEAVTLHMVLVLRRLRHLPPPADDVAQELIDEVFAHLEIALRETGVGDFGVPKRMKKLARAFYDRTAGYDAALDSGSPDAIATALAERLGTAPGTTGLVARYALDSDAVLARADLQAILSGPTFAAVPRSE